MRTKTLKEVLGLPDPEPQVDADELAFQRKQEALLPAIYGGDNSASLAANEKYSANIASLTPEQLATWHVAAVDPDKFEVYHNVYKSEHGFRPRGFINRADCEAWLAPFRVPA